MSTYGIAFVDGLAQRDLDRVVGGMTDDVTVHVAVHDTPMRGRDTARFLFDEFDRFEPVEIIGEPPRLAVRLAARIADRDAEGVVLLSLNDDSNVRQMTVLFRPLAVLKLIADRIGARMQIRFGAPLP